MGGHSLLKRRAPGTPAAAAYLRTAAEALVTSVGVSWSKGWSVQGDSNSGGGRQRTTLSAMQEKHNPSPCSGSHEDRGLTWPFVEQTKAHAAARAGWRECVAIADFVSQHLAGPLIGRDSVVDLLYAPPCIPLLGCEAAAAR